MKKTLTTIGIWLGAQITVTVIFMIAALIMKMDMTAILAPSLLVSDFLVIVLLLILKYCGLKELFKGVPVDILLISIVFALSGMFAVDILATSVKIPNILEEQFQAMAGTVTGFLGICIIGPIMEEMMMRRVILKEMEKLTKSMWWGIIISSALFAIVHINPIQVVFAMPAGIFLGWLYCKTGSLLVPICIHIINNTISFIVMSVGSDTEIGMDSTFGKIMLIAFIAVSVATYFWLRAKLRSQKIEEATVEPAQATDKEASEENNNEE